MGRYFKKGTFLSLVLPYRELSKTFFYQKVCFMDFFAKNCVFRNFFYLKGSHPQDSIEKLPLLGYLVLKDQWLQEFLLRERLKRILKTFTSRKGNRKETFPTTDKVKTLFYEKRRFKETSSKIWCLNALLFEKRCFEETSSKNGGLKALLFEKRCFKESFLFRLKQRVL